ncbi:serine/threonine-protein kinase [Streptomyces bacillaris]|uniref:serine/threonine-protein kinase n=1 Tax=Streptomyces bacillaris TaxID=68179 RepID=UPI00346717D4
MFELLDDRYRLGRRVGGGEVEESRDAWDVDQRRAVRVRLLSGIALEQYPETLAGAADHGAGRFLQAAQTMVALSAPHLAGVRGHGECEMNGRGVRYLVVENAGKRTIRDALQDNELPTLDVVVRWGTQLCEALAAIHLAGLVHADLSPDNIVVTEDGSVMLLAPGIAPLAGKGGVPHAAEYTSPELSGGPRDAGPASDLYSLGCLLYHLVTGHPPFTGTSEEVLRLHRESSPEPSWRHAPLVPQRLDHLLRELLAKDPAHRPSDAHQVADRLRTIADRPLPRSGRASTLDSSTTKPADAVPADGNGKPADDGTTGGRRPLPLPATLLLILTVSAATWTMAAVHTTLGIAATSGLTLSAVLLFAVLGQMTIAVQEGRDSGPQILGGVLLLVVTTVCVATVRQVSEPWWIGVLLGVVFGAGASLAVVMLYGTLVGGMMGVFQRYRYPLTVREWAAAAAAAIGLAAYGAVTLGGRESWEQALLWGAGAWVAGGFLLGVLLIRYRKR